MFGRLSSYARSKVTQSITARTERRLPKRAFEQLEARNLLAVVAQPDAFSVAEDTVLDIAATQTILPRASVWNYTASNGDISQIDPDFNATWHTQGLDANAYDGPAFASGPAPLTYGGVDGTLPPSTVLGLLVDLSQTGHLPDTAYFWRSFDYSGNPANISRLFVDAIIDDGAVFYLNGEEVGRFNMGDQADTFAARAVTTGNEGQFRTFDLTNRLVPGQNVFAMSVHNVNFQGADLGFELSLLVTEDRGNVLANDVSDLAPPDDRLRVVAVNGLAVGAAPVTVPTIHGSVVMRADGTFRYTPEANYHGSDSFTYVAADAAGESLPTTVTLNVTAVNDAPVAVDDAYTLEEDTTLIAESPSLPQVVLPRGATWDYFDELTNGNADGYGGGPATPDEDYPRDALDRAWHEPSFDATTSDPAIGAWKVGVAPFVQELGTPPPSVGTLLAGAAPAHTTDLFRTRFTLTAEQAAAERIWMTGLLDDGGVLYLNGQEILRRNMPAGPLTTHTFAVTSLGTGTEVYTSEPILVSGSLLPGENVLAVELHQAYINTSDRIFDLELHFNDPSALGVTVNDFDVENSPLVAELVAPPQHGTVVLEPSGRFTYTPDLDYHGPDSFTYIAREADGQMTSSQPATVRLTITPVDDSLIALPDAFEIDEDTLLSGFNLLANDSTEYGPLVIALATPAVNGNVTIAADGTFTYLPKANYFGSDSFVYRVSDSLNDFEFVTVDIVVRPVNDAPQMSAVHAYSLREDQPLVVPAAYSPSLETTPSRYVWSYNQSIAYQTPGANGTYPVDLSRPSVAWHALEFSLAGSSSPWLSGASPFAAGQIDQFTNANQFTKLNNAGVNTILFRTTFTLTAEQAASVARAFMSARLIDDGGVLYLNGHEVWRFNLPDGPLSTDTHALAHASETMDFSTLSFDIGGYVIPGENVWAFELHQAGYSPATMSEYLRLTEIMYHPLDPTAAEQAAGFTDGNDFEFLEFTNSSELFTIDLAGATFTHGVEFTFGDVSLAPGERGVLVASEAAFRARYGNGPRILGEYAGALSNAGERLRMTHPLSFPFVFDMTYGDSGTAGWPDAADGEGRSLTLRVVATPPSQWSQSGQWINSDNEGGSPGGGDPEQIGREGAEDAALLANLNLGLAYGVLLDPAGGTIDVEGNAIRAVLVEGPQHGSLDLNPDGSFTYTPDRNFFGNDSFQFVLADDDPISPATSDVYTVPLRVRPDSAIVTCEDLDWNRNGSIDGGDLAGVAGHYGETVSSGAKADFNANGIVDLADVIYLQSQLGQSCGPAGSMPAASAVVRAAAVDAVLDQRDSVNASRRGLAVVRSRPATAIAERRSTSIPIGEPASAAAAQALSAYSTRRALRQLRADRADQLIESLSRDG